MTLKPALGGTSAAARRGLKALEVGDLKGALQAYRTAVRNEPGIAALRFRLALIEDALGSAEAAVRQLSLALALKPDMSEAAEHLSGILSRGKVSLARVRPGGLEAALAHRTIDRDVVAAASLEYLAEHTDLGSVLALGKREGWIGAAKSLCFERTSPILRDGLLLAVLGAGVVARPEVEALLTAVRRMLLLEFPTERRADRNLRAFLAALLQQMWCNEFCWLETDDETRAIESGPVDLDAALSGDAGAEWTLLCHLLYRPPSTSLLDAFARDGLAAVHDVHLRATLISRLQFDQHLRQRARGLETLVSPGTPTAEVVARQYEAAPYPRWTGLQTVPSNRYLADLASRFPPGRLGFTEKPFDVLIAGCGTGRQAVSAALEYGPNARVLGIDISRASLGYAEVMAQRFGAGHLQLAIGDIDRLDQVQPSLAGRFKVIECTGVMHHMPDLFGAWRKLLACLADDGVMFIALYSATARRPLGVLRGEPEFPGAGADDAALRRYRHHLITRLDTLPHGKSLKHSRDFHSASGFRDYLLHVHETTTTLPEIEAFLEREGLTFHGFVGPRIEALRVRYPHEPAPGSLARWAELEEASPAMFSGMYQFWVSKMSR